MAFCKDSRMPKVHEDIYFTGKSEPEKGTVPKVIIPNNHSLTL